MFKYVEQIIYRITLNLPPSVNKRLMQSSDGKRLISTPEWRQWKAEALRELKIHKADQVLAQLGQTPYKLKIVVDCWFENQSMFNSSDADNRLKAAQDAVCEAMGTDDKNVYEAIARMSGIEVWKPAHVNVTVLALFGNITEGLGNAY